MPARGLHGSGKQLQGHAASALRHLGHRLDGARIDARRNQSGEHFIEYFRAWYGPTLKAFASLAPAKQQELHAAILELLARRHRGTRGPRFGPALPVRAHRRRFRPDLRRHVVARPRTGHPERDLDGWRRVRDATGARLAGGEFLVGLEAHRRFIVASGVDVVMPDGSGIEALPALLKEHPDLKVLILSMQDDPRYVREAFAAGASGYVLKEAADTEVVEAIREVAKGGRYVHPELGARLVPAHPGDVRQLLFQHVEFCHGFVKGLFVVGFDGQPEGKQAIVAAGGALHGSAKSGFDDFDEAIRRDPKDAVAFYNRSVIWSIKGDKARATADYEEAVRLKPSLRNH